MASACFTAPPTTILAITCLQNAGIFKQTKKLMNTFRFYFFRVVVGRNIPKQWRSLLEKEQQRQQKNTWIRSPFNTKYDPLLKGFFFLVAIVNAISLRLLAAVHDHFQGDVKWDRVKRHGTQCHQHPLPHPPPKECSHKRTTRKTVPI